MHSSPLAAEQLSVPSVGAWQGGSLPSLLEGTGSTSFLVLSDGQLVYEWYASNFGADTVTRTLSVTKSVASLLVGQAVGDGRLPGVDTPLGELLPGLADLRVAAMTIEQLMRMSSGIRYREGVTPWSDDALVYHGSGLRQTARRVHVADPVDKFFHYNDWHPLLIAMVLERASNASIAQLLSADLWAPLDAGPAAMTLDHSHTGKLAHLESGLNATPHGLARFGQLVLQRGIWNGKELVSPAWLGRLDDLSSGWNSAGDFAYYESLPWGRPLSSGKFGYKDFWWHYMPHEGVHDLFAMGALGAHVYVSRDTGCVLVRTASRFPRGVWWAGILRNVAEQVANR
ncbi:beta-lactamase family protein [Paraburkholderia sp. MMS20-SJTN17]|uniref:Beta-lactamase family protein n=1 Tax=Paraburkholderia translucens TaxID=2886945 RepID=A0ABS8KKN7_9BURK|nr:serine hydrolase [Paraburkholderia sp. MMS20-SJTN17]MCC8405333.1 beta-lactamase family protein [Paraburkholderia sp. MMS20-SJTN17]